VALRLYIPLRLTTTIMIWRRTVPYRRAVSPALIVRTAAAAAAAVLRPIAIVFIFCRVDRRMRPNARAGPACRPPPPYRPTTPPPSPSEVDRGGYYYPIWLYYYICM